MASKVDSNVDSGSQVGKWSLYGTTIGGVVIAAAGWFGWAVTPLTLFGGPSIGAIVGAGIAACNRGVNTADQIVKETAVRTGEYFQTYIFPLLATAYLGYFGTLFTKEYLGICESFFSNPNCAVTAATGIAAGGCAIGLGLSTTWSIIFNSCEGKERDSKKHEIEMSRLEAEAIDQKVARAVNLENKEIHRHDVSTAVRATGWTIGTIGLAGLYSSVAIGLGLVSAPVTAPAALGYSVPVIVGGLGTALKGEKMYEDEKKLAQVEKNIRKKN